MNNTFNNVQTVNIYNNTSISLRVCSQCHQNKALTEFNKEKTKSGGLQSCCKSCRSIKAKHYYDKNRKINANKLFNKNDIKTCSKCKQQNLYTEFHKCATNLLGLDTYCKQCKSNNPYEYFRQSFHKALNNGIKSNNDECLLIMGCNSDFLQLWFEFQFNDKMNWKNYR